MKRIIGVILSLMLSLGMLSGCSSSNATAESIIKDMNEKTASITSMKAVMDASMTLTYDLAEDAEEDSYEEDDSEEGSSEETEESEEVSEDEDSEEESSEDELTMSYQAEVIMDMEITNDPEAYYLDESTIFTEDDSDTEDTSEIYIVTQDEDYVIYSYYGGDWYYYTVAQDEYGSATADLDIPAALGSDDITYTLSDESEKINDEDCYVLTATISGDILQSVAGTSINSLAGVELDTTDYELPITLLVYKDSKMPAQVRMDLSDILNDGMSDYGIIVSDFEETLTFESFNDLEAIEVPDDVKENAIDYDSSSATEEDDSETIDISGEDFTTVDTTDEAVTYSATTVDDPAAIGDWVTAYATASDGTCYQVGVKIDSVERGDGFSDQIDALSELYGEDVMDSLHEGLEYVMVTYEVYVPTDYPDETFTGIEMYVKGTDGNYFELGDDYDFNDMYWVQTTDDSQMGVGPGETATVRGLYTMTADTTEYLFEIGDAWGSESYVLVNE